MSWSSLFSFSNPNGELGKTFTATIASLNSTLVTSGGGVQNLASFASLPVGVYAISMDVPLVTNTTTGTNLVVSNWEIGASTTSTSSTIFPSSSAVSLRTTYTPPGSAISSVINVNFIISVTSANPVFINSSIACGTNDFLLYSATYTTLANCVATKLA